MQAFHGLGLQIRAPVRFLRWNRHLPSFLKLEIYYETFYKQRSFASFLLIAMDSKSSIINSSQIAFVQV